MVASTVALVLTFFLPLTRWPGHAAYDCAKPVSQHGGAIMSDPQTARAEAMKRRRSGRSLLMGVTVAVILSAVGASAGGGTSSATEAGHAALQRHAGAAAATLSATSAGQAASNAQI